MPVVASEMKAGKLSVMYLWDAGANLGYAKKKSHKWNGLSLLLSSFPKGPVAAVPERDSSPAHGLLLPACAHAQLPLCKAPVVVTVTNSEGYPTCPTVLGGWWCK